MPFTRWSCLSVQHEILYADQEQWYSGDCVSCHGVYLKETWNPYSYGRNVSKNRGTIIFHPKFKGKWRKYNLFLHLHLTFFTTIKHHCHYHSAKIILFYLKYLCQLYCAFKDNMLCCCYHIILMYYSNHVANSTFTALCYYSCYFLEANTSKVLHIHNKNYC